MSCLGHSGQEGNVLPGDLRCIGSHKARRARAEPTPFCGRNPLVSHFLDSSQRRMSRLSTTGALTLRWRSPVWVACCLCSGSEGPCAGERLAGENQSLWSDNHQAMAYHRYSEISSVTCHLSHGGCAMLEGTALACSSPFPTISTGFSRTVLGAPEHPVAIPDPTSGSDSARRSQGDCCLAV